LGSIECGVAIGSIATPACGDLGALLFELPGVPFLLDVIVKAAG